MKGYAPELPVQLWDDSAGSLDSANGCGDDMGVMLWGPWSHGFPREAIHSLLGGVITAFGLMRGGICAQQEDVGDVI